MALSPIPIIAVILVLGTPRARSDGPAFALGWVLGMVVVSVVVVVVADGAHDPDSTSADTVNWGTLGLGVLFLVMAMREWRKRPRHGEAATMPKWMQTIDTIPPGKALVLGAALSGLNPKNLALTLAASASIAQAGLSDVDTAIAIAVFVVIASVSVVGSGAVLRHRARARGEAAGFDQGVHVGAQRGDHVRRAARHRCQAPGRRSRGRRVMRRAVTPRRRALAVPARPHLGVRARVA